MESAAQNVVALNEALRKVDVTALNDGDIDLLLSTSGFDPDSVRGFAQTVIEKYLDKCPVNDQAPSEFNERRDWACAHLRQTVRELLVKGADLGTLEAAIKLMGAFLYTDIERYTRARIKERTSNNDGSCGTIEEK